MLHVWHYGNGRMHTTLIYTYTIDVYTHYVQSVLAKVCTYLILSLGNQSRQWFDGEYSVADRYCIMHNMYVYYLSYVVCYTLVLSCKHVLFVSLLFGVRVHFKESWCISIIPYGHTAIHRFQWSTGWKHHIPGFKHLTCNTTHTHRLCTSHNVGTCINIYNEPTHMYIVHTCTMQWHEHEHSMFFFGMKTLQVNLLIMVYTCTQTYIHVHNGHLSLPLSPLISPTLYLSSLLPSLSLPYTYTCTSSCIRIHTPVWV